MTLKRVREHWKMKIKSTYKKDTFTGKKWTSKNQNLVATKVLED